MNVGAMIYLVVLIDIPRAAPETARPRVVGAWSWRWLATLHYRVVSLGAGEPSAVLAGRACAIVEMDPDELDVSTLASEMLQRWRAEHPAERL